MSPLFSALLRALAEHRPGQRIDIVLPPGRVVGLLVGHGDAAHASPSPGKRIDLTLPSASGSAMSSHTRRPARAGRFGRAGAAGRTLVARSLTLCPACAA